MTTQTTVELAHGVRMNAAEVYRRLCEESDRHKRREYLRFVSRSALKASEGAPDRVREYCEAFDAGVF